MDLSTSRYTILSRLGQGGMGVVHLALDTRLGRRVALKTIREPSDPIARERLLLEARAAAALNHPNICQIYDVGEEAGELFVAMELLEGEPLRERIARGPMPVSDALPAMLGILAGLSALHARGFAHRDIKPSNVQLTPHGAKILDFGLAAPVEQDVTASVTRFLPEGGMAGTPRYMAPERWRGGEGGPASDIFAAGAILFEMLTGEPAFPGKNAMDLFDAITRRNPPALSGSAAALAADRVIQRALEKNPRDRYRAAEEMAKDLRDVVTPNESATILRVRRTTRFAALPLQILRPDPETDFLAFSLPDAVTGSLASHDSVVVRPILALSTAERHSEPGELDFKAIATAAEVDLLLTGTLMRAGDRVRVTVHLIDAVEGAVAWSNTAQVTLGDLFRLQDDLARQILDSLLVPLSHGGPAELGPDVPATPAAYEHYLRGNQIALSTVYAEPLFFALEHYESALREDPSFAPAWARIGRVHRLIAKYGHGDPESHFQHAQDAFSRALELNPDLPAAHNLYTYLQVEEGRALEALSRVIKRGRLRSNDPDLFAGIVVAARFCGLLNASVAADRRVKRLDSNLRTSVHRTWLMLGEYESAIAGDCDEPPSSRLSALTALGREEEAAGVLLRLSQRGFEGVFRVWLGAMQGAVERRPERVREAIASFPRARFHDPEAFYVLSRCLARVRAREESLHWLTAVVEGGFWCLQNTARDPWFESLRDEPEFRRLLEEAEAHRRRAAEVFEQAGGEQLLGVSEA